MSMRPHVSLYLFVFVTACVHVCVCSHVICHFGPSHLFVVLVWFVCCCSHCSHPPPPPPPPPPSSIYFISLSLYLPHRLPITLHKARITQATPFHLLPFPFFLSLLTIQSPSCLLYKVFFLLSECFFLLYLCCDVQQFGGVEILFPLKQSTVHICMTEAYTFCAYWQCFLNFLCAYLSQLRQTSFVSSWIFGVKWT